MKPSNARKLVAEILRDVAAELDDHRPPIWPSTEAEDRVAAASANDAIDAVQRALNKTADNLVASKSSKIPEKRKR